MFDIITIIGTIASVGSIPLAIFLFIKNSEQKIIRLRREIVKTLSYQLGDDRQLSSFEIQSVINSKTRENKVKQDSILVEEIIEDLIHETLSNPLIDNEKKDFFLNNFRGLLSRNEIHELIEKIVLESKNIDDIKEIKIDKKLKSLLEQDKANKKKEIESLLMDMKRRNSNITSLFGIIAIITTLFVTVIAFLGKDVIQSDFIKLTENRKELFSILLSVIAGIITLIATFGIKRITKKKK